MKKIVSLALVLAMLVAFLAGCASDQKKLVGTWKGELDMTEAMMEEMGDQLEGLELNDFKVTVVFTFTKEGIYTMELDKASVEKAVDGLVESMEGFMKAMWEEQAKKLGLSLDDLLAASGLTVDDLMNTVAEAVEEKNLVGQMVEKSRAEGRYKAEKGKLFKTTSLDQEPGEDTYDTYTLEGDVLTLTATHGGAEGADAELITAVYPIILKKAA